jgi:hypothetical protein
MIGALTSGDVRETILGLSAADTDGEIRVYGVDNRYVSFDGVTFRAGSTCCR